jgi:prolyl-tRNA editing enzyme YbaK/EbsC (Cys-tRNA(Pro) deacylase)
MHPNAMRVQKALAEAGSPAQVTVLPDSAHTAPEAAAALGIAVEQIAKSLVFMADGRPVVVVLRGSDRLDPDRLRAHVGAATVQRADADSVRSATGYPIGGVSPVGLGSQVQVLIDEALSRHETVWAAAGTPHAVFESSFSELLRVSGGCPADVRDRR